MLSGTVTRSHLVLGKFCWGVLLGMVQLLTLFFTGQLLFGLDVSGHLPALFLICIAAAAACTAFGLLIASVTASAESARSLATFLILVMSALGGAWFPISLMPEFIQQIAKLTLVFWAMEGFTGVLWAGRSTLEILPCVGILAFTALVVMLAALWRFRRSRVFE
jgi:ABC-2 type transport system permease protein